jgi:predicted kinase
MKTIIMLRGLPASGKSTWARKYLANANAGTVKRVNKDDLRAMLDGGKWSPENEKFVLQVRDNIIGSALDSGKHVIVDDTNLAPKHEARLRELAKKHGADFQIIDFTHVSVDECIERDRGRPNYVGEKVIRDMHQQFLVPAYAA